MNSRNGFVTKTAVMQSTAKQEKVLTENYEDAIFRRMNVRSFDVDLTRVGAGIIQNQTPNYEHVRRRVTNLAFLNVVLLVAVDDLIDDLINLDAVITRQHCL